MDKVLRATVLPRKLSNFRIWRKASLCLALLVPLLVLACSDSGLLPVGKGTRGETLILSIEKMKRVPEIRFKGLDEAHYLVTPASKGNELVILRLNVYNQQASTIVLTVDEEAAELRGFEQGEKFSILNLYLSSGDLVAQDTVRFVDDTHPSEDLYVPFIAGPIELPQRNSVIGWVVFEVHKGIKLRELRWAAGDVLYVRS